MYLEKDSSFQVATLIGKKNCITKEDGYKIRDLLLPPLQRRQYVELDFSGIEIFASPFFNAAIGTLLENISLEDLENYLSLKNLKPVGVNIFNLVVSNSLQYYTNENFRNSLNLILNDTEE